MATFLLCVAGDVQGWVPAKQPWWMHSGHTLTATENNISAHKQDTKHIKNQVSSKQSSYLQRWQSSLRLFVSCEKTFGDVYTSFLFTSDQPHGREVTATFVIFVFFNSLTFRAVFNIKPHFSHITAMNFIWKSVDKIL